MKKLLFFGILILVCSCKNQTQESKNAEKKEDTKPKVVLPIDRNAEIPFDTTLVKKLTKKELTSIFSRNRQFRLGIDHKLYQGYSYTNPAGKQYLLLSDNIKTIIDKKDTLYKKIYAVNVKTTGGLLKKRSSVKGEIDPDWETSIGFWNTYSKIADFDKDGEVEFILTYGTTGPAGYQDGKIRILVFHKKSRVSIKHQNSEVESGRFTKINKRFYILPIALQQATLEIMKRMSQNGHATFTEGWKTKMDNKELRLEPN